MLIGVRVGEINDRLEATEPEKAEQTKQAGRRRAEQIASLANASRYRRSCY